MGQIDAENEAKNSREESRRGMGRKYLLSILFLPPPRSRPGDPPSDWLRNVSEDERVKRRQAQNVHVGCGSC